MVNKFVVVAVILLTVASLAKQQQEQPKANPKFDMKRIVNSFDEVDTNKDGKLTKEEMHAYMMANLDKIMPLALNFPFPKQTASLYAAVLKKEGFLVTTNADSHDANNDGLMDKTEWLNYLTAVIFDSADNDQPSDALLSRQEAEAAGHKFVGIIQKYRPKQQQ